MATHHISIRVNSDTFDRLEKRSRRAGQTRSHLANVLLEEGLRMEEHPGIVFRSGPGGRRAALAGGPDVWEVARVLSEGGGADRVEVVVRTGLTLEQLGIVQRYYADYRDEIDAWIRHLDEEAERAEELWRQQHTPLVP